MDFSCAFFATFLGRSAALRKMVVERAAKPLLPPHRLVGKVVEGFKRGSKELGWPTANLDPRAFETRLDAATEGVYVGWAQISGQPAGSAGVHKAVLSIGWNPHFDDLKERTVEAYLCHDFGGRDFYGSEMRLLVVRKEARTFASHPWLRRQT